MGSGHSLCVYARFTEALEWIYTKDGCPQVFPSLYTQANPPIKRWVLLPFLVNLGWPCDVLWPTECGRNEAVPVLGLTLKKLAASALFLLEASCHVGRKLWLYYWMRSAKYRESTPQKRREQGTQSTASTKTPNTWVRSFWMFQIQLNSQWNTAPWMTLHQHHVEQKNCSVGLDSSQ